MKILSLIILIVFCNLSLNSKQIKNKPISKSENIKNKLNVPWADSVFVSNIWLKMFFNKMDSINPNQINKFRKNDTYPFYKLNTELSKKYIKEYSESDSYGVYTISKQYVSDSIISLILFHWGDCIWDFHLVTIDRHSFKYIDSELVLYSASNCAMIDSEQQMTTTFSLNKFRISNILNRWTSRDKNNEDPSKMDIHVRECLLEICEVNPDGTIKREKNLTKINVP